MMPLCCFSVNPYIYRYKKNKNKNEGGIIKMSNFSRTRIYPGIVICAILLLSLYVIATSQVKTEKQGFSVNPRAQFVHEFALQSVGNVTITTNWEGGFPAILTLKDPFGKTYGHKRGPTPLSIVLQVTKPLLNKGGEWRIIFNNESRLKTKGTITITYSIPSTPTPTTPIPTPKGEKPRQGWCCKDGRIFPASVEECRERGGQFFSSREEAERLCREEQPPMPMEEGWCCKDGRIFPANEEVCREQRGVFFPNREEAERHCREEQPPMPMEEGWCCKDGRIFSATEVECREQRGVFFPNREEAERHCREEQPPMPMEEGWCCKDGRIFPATEMECREQGGRFFPNREEAERHCREEQPPMPMEEGWCCKDGRIFPSIEAECREQGGRFFPNREEAERHCREEQPPMPMEEGWCCKDGRIFPSIEAECREQGGRFFPNREEAERHCREEQPPMPVEEGWCCKDGRIFPSIEAECREQGGRFFPNREEAEEHCQKKDQFYQDLEMTVLPEKVDLIPSTLAIKIEDVSPGPGSTPQPVSWKASLWGKMLSLSITGIEGAIGPATSWSTTNNNVLVEHLAAADQNGKLILFYSYPSSDWKAVNISEKTGVTIAIEQPESWVFNDKVNILERIAAPAANGDLMVFTWHAGSDWKATNLSSVTGKKITGPVTSWNTTLGNNQVEHIAARATTNDLLVFWRGAGGNWSMVNVTSLTGQKIGGPATSWAFRSGNVWIEKVAAQAMNGDLILFSFQPSTNWQAKNLSQYTKQKVGGRATDWIAPTGVRVEYLAAPAPNKDLVIFYSDPIEGGWHVLNVTNITGKKVAGPATNWLVKNGGVWWEHLSARGTNGHIYVFFKKTGGTWGVKDVTNITNKTITYIPTSWTISKGTDVVEKLAAPSWDGHMHLFSFTPATNWTTADISLKASGRTVYAAAEKAGVWKSKDYGINWSQLVRPQPAQGATTIGGLDAPVVHDVAVSPVDPRLVFAATGDDRRIPSLAGIYRSKDYGLTWTRVHTFTCGTQVQAATQIIFAPDDPTTLYAAGGCAVAISNNSGDTWSEVTLPGISLGSRVWHIAVSSLLPGDKRTCFACGNGVLWYSPDSGANWYRDNGTAQALPAGFCQPTTLGNGDAAQTLAVEPDNPNHVYLAYQHNANGPSYFHPKDGGPDGVHCNNPVIYDTDNDNVFDTGEFLIWGLGTASGAALKDDPKIKYVESGTNNTWDSNETVVHDANNDGVYNQFAATGKNEPVLCGTAPSVGTHLRDDPKIKYIDLGTPFGPRGCGEGSLWYGDLSGFDPNSPGQLRGKWSQLPGPSVFWGGSGSGAAFVYTHPTASGYLVFFADQDHLFVSNGKPTEGSWHRLDGWDASKNKQQNKLYTVWAVHIDSHGLAISPDFDLTLKKVSGVESPYHLNKELDKCKGGRLWYSNDGGVYRTDDCGETWIPAYSGLSTLAAINVAGVTLPPPGPGPALYFGCGDNDDYYSLNAGTTWGSGVDNPADGGPWFADPAQPNRVVGLSRTIKGAFAVYINPTSLPDPGQGVQMVTVPSPTPTVTAQTKLNLIELPGYRPIIQTLAGETPLKNGDYIVLQEIQPPAPTAARRVLWRAKNSMNTTSPWLQEGPDLPGTVSVVQAAGGHSAPTYYVGDNTRLWKSHRNTKGNIDKWQQIVPGGGAAVARRFFVNPYDANDVYIIDTNTIRHTRNGGTTWPVDTLLDSALNPGGEFTYSCGSGHLDYDKCILTEFIFYRHSSKTRFAVGLAGVFYSGDGTNWFRLLDTRALPGRPVGAYFDPITDPKDQSLYIAFLGRGIMRIHPIPLTPPTPPKILKTKLAPTHKPIPMPIPPTPGKLLFSISNSDFETGKVVPWSSSWAVQVVNERAHSGQNSIRMGAQFDSLDQLSHTFVLPGDKKKVTLSYWWWIDSDDHQPWADTLRVLLEWEDGAATLEALTNSDQQFRWCQSRFDLSAYRGKKVTITFRSEANAKDLTLFYLDDIRLDVHD